MGESALNEEAMPRWMHLLVFPPWWVWPVMLVLLAIATDVAALTLVPLEDEFCYVFGQFRFGGECGFTTMTGLPCPQCGMTRSFTHGVRLHLVRSFFYNPAGFALFSWINIGGFLGAVRLYRRDGNWMALKPWMFVTWIMIWLFPLYLGGWALRLYGVNVLP